MSKVIHMSKLNRSSLRHLITTCSNNSICRHCFSVCAINKRLLINSNWQGAEENIWICGGKKLLQAVRKNFISLMCSLYQILCDQIEPDETDVTCMGKTERTGTVGKLREGVDESISKGMTCEGVGWIHLPD